MASNYLITGYWGEPHVTAENDRGINAATFGTGRFVLPVGEQFRAEYIGNNTIRMYDGKLMDNGAAAGIPAGRYIDLLVPETGQGMNRNDLIAFQYAKDASTLVESGTFAVIHGTETTGTAVDPELHEEDLLSDEATLDQMALWRVHVSGTVISDPEKLFCLNSIGDRNAPNLLDNSNFRNPVNQRAIKNGNTVNQYSYFIDRWIVLNTCTVSLSSDGMSVSAGEFNQMLNTLGRLIGKTVTVACGFADGVVLCGSGVVVNPGSWQTFAWAETDDGSRSVFISSSTTDMWDFRIKCGGATVAWAALYEGEYTTETLPKYHPKPYADELEICEWYYRQYTGERMIFPGHVTNGAADLVVIFPDYRRMRIQPTVTVSGSITVRGIGGYSSDAGVSNAYSKLKVTPYYLQRRVSSLIIQKTDLTAWGGLTNNTPVSVNFQNNDVLELSADL